MWAYLIYIIVAVSYTHLDVYKRQVHDRAEVKYSTVQNWYPGDAEGKGGVFYFCTVVHNDLNDSGMQLIFIPHRDVYKRQGYKCIIML